VRSLARARDDSPADYARENWLFDILIFGASNMKVKALAFVGIPVTDMKRARAFYEGVLGLKVSEEMMGGKWVEYSLGNNTLAIASVGPQWLPSDQGTGAALEVENFGEAVESLKDRHVPFTTEPFESPCCWMAIIKDPDGNNIVIHKLKPENEKEPCL
jgi:predicted enzyme related to lactoylglutathione lyase